MVHPMPPTDPYRDDRPTLTAENKRLRAELARLKSRRRRVFVVVAAVVALGAVDVLAFGLVRSLINAASDARALGGFALVALLIVGHALVAVRVASRGE